jgi:multicomponent Na+:H+ antiporter subunit D
MDRLVSQSPVLIVVIPLIFAFLTVIFGLWKKTLCYPLVIIALSLCVLSTLVTLNTVMKTGTIHYHLGNWNPPWGIEYVIDYLNAFMAIIVAFIALLVAIYSKRSVEQELPGRITYFYVIYLLLVTGLLGILVTGDMFNLYVFLEIASLAAYALIAIGENGAPLASFRYVIMGTIGACFYLLGVGYLYIVTGSLNMADLSQILPNLYHSKVILVAFVFFMIGVAIKMALFPLHVWLPDAYTYAPSTVSAILAPLMTKVGCYVMIRVMYFVFEPYFSIELIPSVTTILGWLAAIAMIVGSIYAIVQYDLKQMLAYSTVAQIGYIVMGVALANKAGFTGSLLHILNEAFTKGCLFLVAGAIMYRVGMRNIYQFRYLFEKMPFTMIAFVTAALSMIGIPPTCGFFSKLYLLLGGIDAREWIFVAALLISTVLNVVYFFNVIRYAYFKSSEQAYTYNGESIEETAVDEVPLSMLIPIWIAVVGIIVTGIFSGKIISTMIEFAIPKAILGGG